MPLRKCIICREMLPKETLTRIIKNKDSNLVVDKTHKAQSRGFYICKKQACLEKCINKKLVKKLMPKNLLEVGDDKEVYEELEKIKNDR